MTTHGMTPITEDDIANFLANTPDFFERHAQVLATIQLTSPHGQRAVSLQERQAEMLREKIRTLEQRIMELIRNGNENVTIADKLHRWTLGLLDEAPVAELPLRVAQSIQTQFLVPQAVIKMWDVAPALSQQAYALGVSTDVQAFASSLTAPYCGANVGFEAVGWLGDPAAAQSLAMIPLRHGPISSPGPALGLLVLASPDPMRFHSGMGTDFLERIGELTSAALARLQD